MNYLVISPVKDEKAHVHRTLESMVRQSAKPIRWILVDDGSADGTSEVLSEYARQHGFMAVVRRPAGQVRGPGSAVVRAFNLGLKAAAGLDYEVLVKLDCDVSFAPDYFERLLREFRRDPKLGIASGVYLESFDGRSWQEIEMPAYHAAGASKVIRRSCFEQIGGFVVARGWDTVDEIRAIARGWRTTHFPELKFRHWKPEGTGIGAMRTNYMHGEVYYRTGGGKLFFLLKVLHRFTRRPWAVAGAALAWGYLRTLLARTELLVTAEEARRYRALLNSRITGRFNKSPLECRGEQPALDTAAGISRHEAQ